jgi:hypothetical protein
MKKSAVIFALFLIGLTAQIGFSQNILTNRDESQMLVKTARFLEETPFAGEAKGMREWAFKYLSETKDVSIKMCAGDLTKPLLDKKNKFGGELLIQYAVGMAAYKFENPKAEETDAQVAGMESALKAYDAMVSADENAKFAGMNVLVEKRDKGGLRTMVIAANCDKK